MGVNPSQYTCILCIPIALAALIDVWNMLKAGKKRNCRGVFLAIHVLLGVDQDDSVIGLHEGCYASDMISTIPSDSPRPLSPSTTLKHEDCRLSLLT
jgi:hypothetical protein